MTQEMGKGKKRKIFMGLLIVGMLVFMAWMWVSSFSTLTEVAKVSDKVYDQQNNNFRHYVNEYKVTKNELDETVIRLNETTQELEAVSLELSNTRGELAQIQSLNDQLKANIKMLERYKEVAAARGEALESMINSFKRKNRELDRDLQVTRKELAEYKPDINDLNQGKEKIHRFKDHIRMVKQNMNGLKRKAFEAKVATQKERDRLESLYGNNGYLMKDGQDKSVTSFDQKKVEINVKFVNP